MCLFARQHYLVSVMAATDQPPLFVRPGQTLMVHGPKKHLKPQIRICACSTGLACTPAQTKTHFCEDVSRSRASCAENTHVHPIRKTTYDCISVLLCDTLVCVSLYTQPAIRLIGKMLAHTIVGRKHINTFRIRYIKRLSVGCM